MGLFGPSKSELAAMEDWSFWSGGADGKLGKHHGGNLHGNPKARSTGKHAKAVKLARAKPKGKGKK
jgi:hypothetical protein